MTSSPWTPTSSISSLPSHQGSPQHIIIHSQPQQSVQAQNALHQPLTPQSPQTTQSTRASSVPGVITAQYARGLEQDPRNQQASRPLPLREEPQARVSQLLTSPGQSPRQPVPKHPNPPPYQAISRAQSVSSEVFHQQMNRDLSQGTSPLNTSSLQHSRVPSNISFTSSSSAAQPLTIRSNNVVSYLAAELPAVCDINVPGGISAPSPGRPVIMSSIPQPETLKDSSSLRKSNHPVGLFCRTCTHCRSGIPYDVSYLECRFCQLYICNDCSNAHPATHHQALLGIVSQQAVPGAAQAEKSCSRCGKLVYCRHDCQECSATFCNDCQKRDDSHEHRAFTSIEAPFHSLKVPSAAFTQDCCSEITVSICTRCQSPIDLREEAIQCKTCLITYDETVSLCHFCHVESWTAHDQSHQVVSLTFQPVANDTESGLGCRQCDEKFNLPDMKKLARHPHNSFFVYLGPQARESAVSAAYRLCQRKRVRKDRSQVMKCARCKHEFPSQTMRICVGDCKGNFCDECFPLASLSHVHGPTHFRSLNDEACPDIGFLPDGWRAMRNSEGRNYYLLDKTGHFTFEKPRLPDSLPAGWVAMIGARDETVYVNKITNTVAHISPIFGVAPEGWDLKQTKTGRLFYVNRQTQVTTWHKPQPDDGDPLPPGWEAGRHADGQVYYINHFTKTNTWTKPTTPANAISTPTSGTSQSHSLLARSVTAPIGRPSSLGPGPASFSTRGVQPTRPMSITTQRRPVMTSVQPAVVLPVAAPTTNFQTMGSPVTLQGPVTIISPQPAPQMAGQNAVTVMTGQGPVTMISAPQTAGQGSVQVPFTQPVAPAQFQQTVSHPPSSQGATGGSVLNTLAHNPRVQSAALHLGIAALNDSTTHSTSHSVSSGSPSTHANINLSQSSINGTTAGYSSPSTWASSGTDNSNLQFQSGGGVGNTGPTILTPTSNPPSFQSTASTDYGSINNFEVQNNSNIVYANNPPAYSPTGTEDPTAAISSSMATLLNSNGSVNNDNSQYQYSNISNPPATTYTVTDNSALTASYYGTPSETYVQTEDVQVTEVSSNGTSSFTDYTTFQTQTAGYPQDDTTDYVGGATITDVSSTGFDYTDSSASLDLI